MAPKTHRLRLAAAIALSFACDPGFSVNANVIVPEDIAAAYTAEQRGLLLVSITPDGYDPELTALAVICGEGSSHDAGTGALGNLPNTRVLAWIEALPADDTRPCGPVPEEDRDGLSDPFLGDFEVDDDEPQARETIAEASGCDSNIADLDLTLALPD